MRFATFCCAALAALTLPAAGQDAGSAEVSFVNKAGEKNGTATLTALPKGVLGQMEVTGLPPNSWVAVHFHETGTCDHTTGHESAGGHFNPAGGAHGYLAEGGFHAGDMPNQYVGADGTLRAEILNNAVTLDAAETSVHGRALMVHGGKDDYTSQPSGNAGDRQACGVIE